MLTNNFFCEIQIHGNFTRFWLTFECYFTLSFDIIVICFKKDDTSKMWQYHLLPQKGPWIYLIANSLLSF